MESGDPPSLHLVRPWVTQFVEQASPGEQQTLWAIFFSLLLDPNPDNESKFENDVYPYTGRGVREYVDREFMISYREDERHSVHILRIFRQQRLRQMRDDLGLGE